MFKKQGRYLLFALILLFAFAFKGNGVQASAPSVLSASYIDAENVLEIVFDQPVFSDSIHVIRGGITLDGDDGGSNPDLTLSGGLLPGNPPLTETIHIGLTYVDQQVIETMADKETLELVLASNAFLNENMEGNAAIDVEDNIAVDYVVDEAAPVIVSASYDAGENILTVVFDKAINGRQVELTKISIHDALGGSVKFSSIDENIETQTVAATMQIAFSPKHQRAVEKLDVGSLTLNVLPFAFINENRNSSVSTGPDNVVNIGFVPDPNPTVLYSASYDAVKNNLQLFFNEKVVTTFWGAPAVNYRSITIHNLTDSESATLSGAAAVSVTADTQLVIMVLPSDQRLIENLTSKSDLRITLSALAVIDDAGNGIREYTLEDNISVEFLEESEQDAPVITEASYDASTNILALSFGNITARTKGIDTTNVDLTGVSLDDDNGGANPDVALSGGVVVGIKTGRPAFIRMLEITVNTEDEARIETFTNKDQISIGVKPLSFFFESYTKTRNGNHTIPAGQIAVNYTPDSTAAEIEFAKYDFIENQFSLRLDKLVSINDFNPTGVSVGGVRLTGGTVVESGYSKDITIDVSESDQANIESIDNATKTDIVVSVDQDMLKNLDGFTNAEISVRDGDVTAKDSLVVVGYGRGFWDQSFEAFKEVDHLVQTSIRAVGEHCYIYVADDEWQTHVARKDVDSLLIAFEQSTPADPSKGIYQICRETFGEEKDTDGDPRILIVLLDIRDEFDQGRSNTYADLPKAGYFDERDLLSKEENAHSNEADILYIDTHPIVEAGTAYNALADNFHRMINYNVEPDEEQWLVEGLSAVAEVICGYGFTDYRYPAALPFVPFDNLLIHWTGWQAGAPSDLYDLSNVFLFNLYLYEQYGGVEIIKKIAADSAKGLTSVQNALTAMGYDVTVGQVFDDYAIACYKDVIDHPVYGSKYGFVNTDLGTPGQAIINWPSDEWWDSQSQWSFSYFMIKQKHMPNTLLFNGNNETDLSLQFMPAVEDFEVQKVELDDKKEASVDLSSQTNTINLVVCSKSEAGPAVSPFVLSRNTSAPQYVNLGIFQNPSIDKSLNIYVVSKERLYLDLPTDDPTLTTTGEGPQISLTLGDEAQTLVAERDFANSAESMFQYRANFTVWGSGNYTVAVDGQDMSGNVFATVSSSLTVQKILASTGGLIAHETGKASMQFATGSVTKDAYVSVTEIDGKENAGTIPETAKVVGNSYRFGPENIKLSKPAHLILRYEDQTDANSMGIYRRENAGWAFIGGKVDQNHGKIEVNVDRLGEFRILQDESLPTAETLLPTRYDLSQNYPNPFNAATIIEYQLPESADISLKIYDTLGKQVAVLVEGRQSAGFYHVNWDGTGFSSGLYFYVLNAGDFSKTGKMMLLK